MIYHPQWLDIADIPTEKSQNLTSARFGWKTASHTARCNASTVKVGKKKLKSIVSGPFRRGGISKKKKKCSNFLERRRRQDMFFFGREKTPNTQQLQTSPVSLSPTNQLHPKVLIFLCPPARGIHRSQAVESPRDLGETKRLLGIQVWLAGKMCDSAGWCS